MASSSASEASGRNSRGIEVRAVTRVIIIPSGSTITYGSSRSSGGPTGKRARSSSERGGSKAASDRNASASSSAHSTRRTPRGGPAGEVPPGANPPIVTSTLLRQGWIGAFYDAHRRRNERIIAAGGPDVEEFARIFAGGGARKSAPTGRPGRRPHPPDIGRGLSRSIAPRSTMASRLCWRSRRPSACRERQQRTTRTGLGGWVCSGPQHRVERASSTPRSRIAERRSKGLGGSRDPIFI